jgi:hypothetical protein
MIKQQGSFYSQKYFNEIVVQAVRLNKVVILNVDKHGQKITFWNGCRVEELTENLK